MATTETSESDVVYERRVERLHKYHWPAIQLNVWMLFMLVASSAILGIFASFIQTQQQLRLGVPWYFPYYITVSAIVIIFIWLMLWLIFQRRLLPSIVMIGGFMLFVLWLVGLIVVSVELWGPNGVSSSCNTQVFNTNPTGQSLQTLAWLEQKSICQGWQAVFALGLVGSIFLLWIMIMAYQVFAMDR
ncbi:hypothetical protein M406DRAFT_340984 [Cryphonectria parasitica EP155]|uniref:Arginase-like protein n=1 Tax=Cryphonectria parasitica (strain ATCC 38755 / EP155) TaxID=660469 RepID=A0A9P4XXY8_CRYP1|nr:uncharacterized protein M406DRAFT_340984 [Cryphonectria parasitica EP155]KAF3763402.1 hypothetical protein M406DRAFT_340984 [Cryphonectria parasitica EP155]